VYSSRCFAFRQSEGFCCQAHRIENVCSFRMSYISYSPQTRSASTLAPVPENRGGGVCSVWALTRAQIIYNTIPVFWYGCLMLGMGISWTMVSERYIAKCMVLERLPVGQTQRLGHLSTGMMPGQRIYNGSREWGA